MALKDIFTMIKADRYTADGCEEIKKAQKAIKEETADAGLPDGSVSHRKDGDYIKKAGKWVPAPAAKAGAKNAPKAKSNHPPRVMPKGMEPEEFMKMWEDDAKKHGFGKGQGEEWREYLRKEEGYKPIEKPKENKPANKKSQFDEWEEEVRQSKASLDKQAAKVTKVLSTPADKALYKDIYSFADDEHTDFKSALYTIAEGVAEDAKEKGRDKNKDAAIIKMARALGVANDLKRFISDEHDYRFASDAAPRELTGDCKIKIRRS